MAATSSRGDLDGWLAVVCDSEVSYRTACAALRRAAGAAEHE